MKKQTADTYRAMAEAIALDRFGYPLGDWISDKRSGKTPMSWQKIADELSDRTDGIVSVSWMTIQRWSEDAA